MNYYGGEDGIRTLELALDSINADELRKLVALTGQRVPSKKGDMTALIVQHLAGERLRTVWEGLDELQRAAVAEAVHSPSSRFDAGRFRAKYGRDPNWGSAGKASYDHKKSALCFFLYRNNVLPADLKARLLTFVPARHARRPSPRSIGYRPPTGARSRGGMRSCARVKREPRTCLSPCMRRSGRRNGNCSPCSALPTRERWR
jgi:hypothetical protein